MGLFDKIFAIGKKINNYENKIEAIQTKIKGLKNSIIRKNQLTNKLNKLQVSLKDAQNKKRSLRNDYKKVELKKKVTIEKEEKKKLERKQKTLENRNKVEATKVKRNERAKEKYQMKKNLMKKPYTHQKLYNNVIFYPDISLTYEELKNGTKQHPINNKIIQETIEYKNRIENNIDYYAHHYLVKVALIDKLQGNELEATDVTRVYQLSQHRRIMNFGYSSNKPNLNMKDLSMNHQDAATIWKRLCGSQDVYTVELHAIVLLNVNSITQTAFTKLKCKAREPLHMKLLGDIDIETKQIDNNGLCALQHILDCIINVNSFQKYSMIQLIDEFQKIGCNAKEGVCIDDLEAWVNKFGKKQISYRCLDPFGIGRVEYKATNVKITIVFFVYDRHIYGIHDESLRKTVINKNELVAANFRENITERKDYIDLFEIFTDKDFGYINNEFSLTYFNDNIKTCDKTKAQQFRNKYLYLYNEDGNLISDSMITDYVAYKYSLLIEGKFNNNYSFLINEDVFGNLAIYKIMKESINFTKTMINPFKIKLQRHNVSLFEHPIGGYIIERSNGNHDGMRQYCDKLYCIFPPNFSEKIKINLKFELKSKLT
jgi:hypothetical protein